MDMMTVKRAYTDKYGLHLAWRGPLRDNAFSKLNDAPGFHKWIGRDFIFRCNGVNIKHIVDHFPETQWLDDTQQFKDEYLADKERSDRNRAAKETELTHDDSGYEFKRPPMDHQRQAFLLSRDQTAYALFMEQGTGKTKVTLDNACYLYKAGKIDMLVVVAWPNGVHRNWIECELPEDIPAWCPYEAVYWSTEKTKKKALAIRKVMDSKGKLKIFTFNVEAFASARAKDAILDCVNNNRCMVVIDQSASIKNPSALRTKFLIDKVSGKALYRRILDGAPVAEGADEFYAQYKFLDPIILGHDTWTAFKAQYCRIGKFNNVIGYLNKDELKRRTEGYSFRARADDCLDLPARTYKKWIFTLSPNERRIFNELNRKKVAQFTPERDEDGRLELSLPLVKNLRLQQIASGWWPEPKNFKAIGNSFSRLDALADLLKQAEGKALIFSRFRADLELIANLLGDAAASFHGGISDDDRSEAKRRFMQDDDCRYFIGQPRTAGIGHTLTAAKHVIFYNNDPSLRFREECEKRAHRKGLEKTLAEGEKLIIWDLIAKGTTDYKTVQALRAKKELANTLLDDPDNFFMLEGDHDET